MIRNVLIAATAVLMGVAANAAPVIQQHFDFVDRNFGAGDRRFALLVMRDGNREMASLVALDDNGKNVFVSFLTPLEWRRFLGSWQLARAALEANNQTMTPWSYEDSSKTSLNMMMNMYGQLGCDIETSGAVVSMFDLTKEQVPEFDAALAKISAHFDTGT
jgi:hypothetical protein